MKQGGKHLDSLDFLREQNRILDRTGIGEPAKDGKLAHHSTLDLIIALQTFLGELSARAIKTPEAAASLWTFAHTACADLWEVCERKPEIIRPCVEKKLTFPVHFPVLKKHQERVAAMMKALGVGTKARYRIGRKQFDPNVPVNALVLRWIECISETQRRIKSEIAARYGAKLLNGERPAMSVEKYVKSAVADIKEPHLKQIMALPPLCRDCADKWAKLVWQMILMTNDGTPEKNPELCKIGEHRKHHSEYIGQQLTATPKTSHANIRDGIRTRVFKAVRDLAG